MYMYIVYMCLAPPLLRKLPEKQAGARQHMAMMAFMLREVRTHTVYLNHQSFFALRRQWRRQLTTRNF